MKQENPFFHRGPIRNPAYFYDRRREIKRAWEMLGQGQSVSITGPRKIGKTSLLFHLSRPEVMREQGLDPDCHVVVYFTCEGSGQLQREELYALILEEIIIQASQQGHTLVPPQRPISYLEVEHFFREASQELKFILLLDEFEIWGDDPDLIESLLPGLRALTTRFDVAYLTVSRQQLSVFTDNHSPFFNIFFPLKLGLFDEAESRELIEGSLAQVDLSLPAQVVDEILALGGGHPFFLQVAGYWALELQDIKGSPLESTDLDLLTRTARSQVASHLEYYWQHLTPQEQYVLAALPFTQNVETYREQLEKLGCLCRITRDGTGYKYFSPLFRDFVRRQEVDNLLQAGPVVLEPAQQEALLYEEPLSLSPTQFQLLCYLVERQGQIVSNREMDRDVLWAGPPEQQAYEYMGDERLKSVIKGLRKALGDASEYIVNKRGVGYMFQAPLEE